jgi:cystathionine beta-lyase/cystathionine gamma-synthase
MASISTQLIHAGEPQPRIEGSVCMPVFQSANFVATDEGQYDAIKYARLNNTPNHVALHLKLAAIENGEAALVLGSGMAAISTALFGLLKSGDHILAQKTVYGGTFSVITEDLKRFGVSVDFVDASEPGSWAAKVKPSTKMVYVESISNPLMEVPELSAVTSFARKANLYSVIDNTFATPVNFRPLDLGFDISLHSATKYLNGHSDIVAGAVIGSKNLITQIAHSAAHLGGTLDPHACFLLHRGMKTLALRMQHHNMAALKVARHLSEHRAIRSVNYPGLESSPSHPRAKEYFSGFGGMLSFELKDLEKTEKFLSALKYPLVAASLGGVESLVILPARSSHLGMKPEDRRAAGIGDGLIRYSVGIEDPVDLIADLDLALNI